MDKAKLQQLCRQLGILDCTLKYLVILILSVFLSWKATSIQREGLCRFIAGEDDSIPDVSWLRLTTGALAAGCLMYFFKVALEVWQEAKGTLEEGSATVNLYASMLVLASALLRLYDMLYLQKGQREEP